MPKIDIVNAKNIIESNPEKAFFKLKNTGGPKGDTGAQGPQGPKGDTGAQGPAGASASVTVGSTTTLSPGADATVTNSGDTRNAILNFGIPTGAQGPQGVQGPKGDTGPMGQTGAKGDTGAAATVQVGNTNTGAPGTNAQVTNAGNEHFAVFNFTIPRGDKGEKGATGAQGQKGDKGDKGDTGTAATITVGSTTTTNPGTSATVTNSGSTSAAVLNFGIPRGATGSVKSEVVSELPETGEGDTFYLVNREDTEQTATGKTINFTNSDNSGDITDFQLDGETSQNGTPTPDAPVPVQTVTGENTVKICGKNLLDSSIENITLQFNCIATVSGNGIEVAGSSSGSTHYASLKLTNISSMLGKQITISLKYSGDSPDARIYYINSSGIPTGYINILTLADGVGLKTLTMPASLGNNAGIALVLYTGSNGTATYSDIQLELGSTATTYEPYQEQEYQVELRGKNWLDISSFVLGGMANGNPDPSAKYRINNAANPIAVKPNTKYTISAQLVSPVQGYRVGIHECDITGNFIRDLGWSQLGSSAYTFTTGATTYYIKIVGSLSTTSTNVTTGSSENTTPCSSVAEFMRGCTLQFEEGASATPYVAYDALELFGIGDDGAGGYLYSDRIYKNLTDNKWYVHKEVGKYTFTGNEVVGKASNTNNNSFYYASSQNVGTFGFSDIDTSIIGSSSATTVIVPVWSSHFAEKSSYAVVTSDTIGIAFNKSGSAVDCRLGFGLSSPVNTAQLLTSWLTANTPTVYYPLATPTDTEITNEALITQLDNVASAPLYTGVNNIFTVTPNEQGTLEIKYVTYDKYNQNKVYIWNDTLQQWQIIVQ